MSTTRAYLGFGLRLAFGVGVLGAMFILVDAEAVLSALGKLSIWLFLGALAINLLGSIVTPALATRSSLAAGNFQIPLSRLVRINLAMRFYVLTLPHAVTVGMRWARYKNSGKGLGVHAVTLILFEKVIQFNIMLGFAFAFLLLTWANLPPELEPLILLCGALLLPGLFVLSTFLSPSLYTRCAPAMEALTRRAPRVISNRLDDLYLSVRNFQNISKTQVLALIGWSGLGYLLFVLSAYVIILGLGLPLNFAEIGWMRSVVFLLTVLPITVGGLGVREAGFAALLYAYGIDGAAAVAFPIVLLGIQLAIGSVGGLVELQRTMSRQSEIAGGHDQG